MTESENGSLAGYVLTVHDTREFHRQLNGHSRSLAQEKDRSNRLENARLAAEEAAAAAEEEHDTVFAEQPLRRPGSREEISGLLLFLLSDQSGYITGHEHVIDGGRTVW